MSTLTVTNGNDSGAGSLRDNIATANSNLAILSINFDPLVTLVTLTTGTLVITRGYTITGAGVNPVIDASAVPGTNTIIKATALPIGDILNIDNITLTGGKAGAMNAGNTTVNLTNVTITGNTSNAGGAGLNITNSTANIVSSRISNNTDLSASFYGGVYALNSTVTIDTSTISNNTAANGAGIYFQNTLFTISNSTISNNVNNAINSNGAGIYVQSSLSNNSINNSTISNNGSSQTVSGGGIYLTTSNLTINNSTITYNTAVTGGGVFIDSGVSLVLNNTLVAKNSATTNSDVSGNVTNSFYSLIQNGTGTNIINGVNGNLVNIEPSIGPLANNGGPTETVALLMGSPGVDAGSILLIPPGTLYDQRQSPYVRISGVNVDIGAFELQQEPVCYKDTSKILVKHISTGEMQYLMAKYVISDIHKVYDTVRNKFIKVKLNAVTGKVSEFYLLKKGCLGKEMPSEDFYVTGGHKLIINGKEIKARNISKAIRVELQPQQVYSICTKYQCPILINNLNVLTWEYDKFLKYSKVRVIDFQNNSQCYNYFFIVKS